MTGASTELETRAEGHVETPWSINLLGSRCDVRSESGEKIALTYGLSVVTAIKGEGINVFRERIARKEAKWRANAAFIVLSGNAYTPMLAALKAINTGECERYTTGPGSCFKNGHTPSAQYWSDRCCPSCIADNAIRVARGFK